MTTVERLEFLTQAQVDAFHEDGYLIVKGLLNQAEVEEIKEHFQRFVLQPPIPGCFDVPSSTVLENDPWKKFPRLLGPEKYSDVAMKYAVHPSVIGVLADLLGEEPVTGGCMYYFKPPGSRGQALHQDNFYLRIEPGTCIGCWMAIDRADAANGGMIVVPKTNRMDIECPHKGDATKYIYTDEVHVPEGASPVQTELEPGDALLFNGSTIHGSGPNMTTDRFRRAYIVHGFPMSSERIGHHLAKGVYDRRGRVHVYEPNSNAGPCGTILPNGAVAP